MAGEESPPVNKGPAGSGEGCPGLKGREAGRSWWSPELKGGRPRWFSGWPVGSEARPRGGRPRGREGDLEARGEEEASGWGGRGRWREREIWRGEVGI